jgi:putative ABC transport system permease protein
MLSRFPFLLPFSLALRNIRTRPGRTLLTLLGIVLGVAVVLAIQITNQSTLASLRQIFDRAAGGASLVVIPSSSYSRAGLNVDLLTVLEGEPGVTAAAPLLRRQTMLASEVSSLDFDLTIDGIAAGRILQLYGVDPQLDPQVRVYDLSAGRHPQAGRYEVTLPVGFANDRRLEVGNDLVIVTNQGVARLEIVGLLSEEGVALLNDGAVAFAPLGVIDELFLAAGELDEISLGIDTAVSEDPRLLAALKERLDERLSPQAEVIYPAARGQIVPQMLATYQLGLSFFSLIAIFVGAFLIYNTFSMTVVERTREIGMLRAIGTSRAYVLRMVLAEAVLLSMVGSLLGLLAGLFLAQGLMALVGAVVSTGESLLAVPLQSVLQSLAVGVGVTLSAALVPALQAARISPLEALRVRSRSSERVRPRVWISGLSLLALGYLVLYQLEWRHELLFQVGSTAVLGILLGATLTVPLVVTALERFTRPFAALVYAQEGSLGSSNVRRSVGRTTLTVASLMVALTMVIGIGSLAYSFEEDITSWIDTALGGDLYVRSPLTMRESFGRQLASVPGVAAVTPARYIDVRVSAAYHTAARGQDDGLLFNAIDPATFRQVGQFQFATGQGDPEAIWARFAQGNALFISNAVASRYALHQGDSLVLLTRRGEQAFTVAAEIVDFTGDAGTVIGSYDDLHRSFSDRGADRFTVSVTSGYPIEQVVEEIETRFKNRQIYLQTTQVFKEKIRELMRQSFSLFDVLNMIGVIIGALGVVNTLTMNVIERRREIGGLRSLGMTRGQVLRMVLAESLTMGVIGGAYGLAFGYLISQVLILGMNLMSGYELVYRFTPLPFMVGILIAFLVSQLAALYPARGAAAVNIVEAIKHE